MKDWTWLWIAMLSTALAVVGCGESSTQTASVGGIAWSFELPGTPYGRIEGATVSVLEISGRSAMTNADGEFAVEGLPVGAEATFVLEHPDFPLTYTRTLTVPSSGIADLTFQIPTNTLFGAIEGLLIQDGIVEGVDPDRCQMVSTFTRFGKTIGDDGPHGEPGAILSVEPENAAEFGPMYFSDDVLPDASRTYSSIDGGVLLLNVEPGDYILNGSCVTDPDQMAAFLEEYPPEENEGESLRCQTEEVEFESVMMKCRAGVFVNASPSYGLQALAPPE